MAEAFVRLVCPECVKAWESSPSELPTPTDMFHCPNCHTSRRVAEFMRTDRDLDVLKRLG